MKKLPAKQTKDLNPEKEMPFIEHIKELRMRIIISALSVSVGMIVCFIFFDQIIDLLTKPFSTIDSSTGYLNGVHQKPTLFMRSITEGFMTKMKVAFISGIILSFPIHIYNCIAFIFPGLHSHEKKLVSWSLGASFFLIITSAYWSYVIIIPLTIKFLTSVGFRPQNVGILLNYGENIFYIFQFFLFSLILFQLPIVMVILMKLNIVKRSRLLDLSRYVIIVIFIISAMVTPPDVISQISIALPLTGLYFLALLVAKIFRLGEG